MFTNSQNEIMTILIAASPVFELRGSIPLAITIYKFSLVKSYLLSIFGNFLPVIPLLLFWKYLSQWLASKNDKINRLLTWLFLKTRTRHSHHFELWKDLALLIFVAIPIPLTGAWSGTLAAFVFNIPIKQAAIMIGLGIMVAGLIVSFLILGGISLF